jgi:hypothetical protein
MKQTTPESGILIPSESRVSLHHILHIAFVCLAPLLWLVLIAGSILLLTSLIHYLTASAGFLVEQQINVFAVSTGLGLSLLVYIIGIVHTLHKIGQWERAGRTVLATGGLWGLGIRAVAIPLLLLLVFFFIVH